MAKSLPRGAIGFRLAHELWGLLQGIKADRAIEPHEVERLRAWLDANSQFSDVRPFSELACQLQAILADGVVTIEEVEDLEFVVAKLVTVNPYFDAIRSGVQVLLGIVAGIAADGRLTPEEVSQLSEWLADWTHLKGTFPYDECEAIVMSLLSKGMSEESSTRLLALASEMPIGGEGGLDASSLFVSGVCAIDPVIQFAGRTFVFTGLSTKASRSECESVVAQRGGLPGTGISKRTDYLVVCAESNALWAFSCFGRKVERAYQLRRAGHSIQIVHEVDFWDALNV